MKSPKPTPQVPNSKAPESIKPWMSGPFELIRHADGHLQASGDTDRLVIDAKDLRTWQRNHILPPLQRMESGHTLVLLSWKSTISTIKELNPAHANQLEDFCDRCLCLAARNAQAEEPEVP